MPCITGTVYDDQGQPCAGRIIRAYRRSDGALLAQTLSSDGTLGDPHWSKVSLLLNFDNDPGSVQVYDASAYGHIATVHGTSSVMADRVRSGSGSLRFRQSGDRVEFADHEAFEMGAGDGTVEFWVNSVSLTASQGHAYLTKSWPSSSNGYGSWLFYKDGSNNLVFYAASGTSSWNIANNVTLLSAANFTQNVWHHIAFSRQGSAIRLFANGVLVATITSSLAMLSDAQPLRLGGGNGANQSVNAYLDGVRITKGVARYTSAFTPEVGPWPTFEGPLPLGAYRIDTFETGEVDVVCLDDAAGVTYNDLIRRTTPA